MISRKSVVRLRGRWIEFKSVSNSRFGRSNIQPSEFSSRDFVTLCSYTYLHTYIHTYIHTYTHTHTYIHTYIHTHTPTCDSTTVGPVLLGVRYWNIFQCEIWVSYGGDYDVNSIPGCDAMTTLRSLPTFRRSCCLHLQDRIARVKKGAVLL
jgi:hypothetical protein